MNVPGPAADAPPAGIPGSDLPGPFAVGSYAAMLQRELRNLKPSRARVYFELRDSGGAVPCAAWLRDWEKMLERGGAEPREGMQVVVAGGCAYYPGSATSSPGFSFAV